MQILMDKSDPYQTLSSINQLLSLSSNANSLTETGALYTNRRYSDAIVEIIWHYFDSISPQAFYGGSPSANQSETPFEWRFAGGPRVAKQCILLKIIEGPMLSIITLMHFV